MQPGLDVAGAALEIRLLIVACASTIRRALLVAPSHDLLLFGIEEVRCLVVFGDEEDAATSPDEGDETLEDVKPSPPRVARNAVHIENPERDQTSKCPG
jgi:hypothetical protein